MARYAPLIFEECYVKYKKLNRVANTFEIEQDPELSQKIDPTKDTTRLEALNNPRKGISNYQGLHLFVMAHGFQGNSYDMRLLKNVISVALPEALFLMSNSYEADTEGDILTMGYQLAQEVHQYIRENCPGTQLARLSFIGYSMGGLIVRAALPYLDKFKDKMHGFITLCTPHVGFMYSHKKSSLFQTGMWFMKKFKKSVSLDQMTFNDEKKMENTCLYKLSKYEGIEWFSHIMLASSYQD
jgi:pimeloyl-ACP methyl ester carboxylesterase